MRRGQILDVLALDEEWGQGSVHCAGGTAAHDEALAGPGHFPAAYVVQLDLGQGACMSRVNCVPNTFHPSRRPSTGWRCHSAGPGGASQY